MILIFSIKITHISLDKKDIFNLTEKNANFYVLRRDIVDRNGVILSRNINTFHVAINPKQIKNKKNFLIKLRLNFPDLPINKIEDINSKDIKLDYCITPNKVYKFSE